MFGNIMNGITGGNHVDKGMESQAWYGAKANEKLDEVYKQQQADLAPWKQSGLKALSGMENEDFQRDFGAQDFQQDPGYNFRLAEGQKALERSAAARGAVQSGATLKALSRYNQDFATNEYQNAYNRFNADRDRRFGRLSGLAGMGQNATNTGVQAAGQYGQAYGQNLMGIGNAMAAGQLAKAQGQQQFIGGLMSLGSRAATGGIG